MQTNRSNWSFQNGTLAEEELVNSLSWLIGLRWLAGIGVVLGGLLAATLAAPEVPTDSLALLGLGLLGYNAVLWWVLRRLNARATSEVTYQWFARLQIGIDWLATALLVHCTGGISSPVIFFFLFHIVIAALLLPHDRAFLYVTLAPILVGGVAALEYTGLIGHYFFFDGISFDDLGHVGAVFGTFTATCYIMAYLSMTVSHRLRRREDQLAALYESLRATTSTLELSEVLDLLAEATAEALDCKAAAIRLLDGPGSRLDWAGVFGLSDEYRRQEPVEVARSPLDQAVLAGDTVQVADVAADTRLVRPEQAIGEGIHSILSAPLVGKRGAIGVLRVYGGEVHRFEPDDAAFLSAIAAQGAVAIENARAYQVLGELDRSKTQFVRIVIHELRSPVTVATSLLKLLDRGYVGDLTEEQADLIERARRRIEFLQTLIDDLLDLAAGRAELGARAARGHVSLSGVFRQVRDRFVAPAQEKGLVLEAEVPDENLVVWGDKDELDRMLNNLVSNAIKYTERGEVRMSLEQVDSKARIIVSDTGIGIPEEGQAHLFQEFFRAENAKRLERSGTGLGLTIVKDLVERYGGQIAVESAEGQGTTFRLTLPLSQVPPERE